MFKEGCEFCFVIDSEVIVYLIGSLFCEFKMNGKDVILEEFYGYFIVIIK